MEKFIPFLGRILLSVIFLVAGFNKITDPGGTQQFMANHGMPWTGFFLACAIIIELGGGLSVLIGYKTRWGAMALTIFLIPVTLIFHTKFTEPTQVIMFMKNLAIMGGLFILAGAGPGKISMDDRSRQ